MRGRGREQLGNPAAEVFCAVPEMEAWLFADDAAVRANAANDEETTRIINRLPLPEEIPSPSVLARAVFGPPDRWEFVRNIDIGRACARSPSLRSFIEGIGELLGTSRPAVTEGIARSISRDVIAGLVSEIPSGVIVWRTASGDAYTAEELRQHIESGSEIGRRYATDLLRVCRDYLRRKAQRAAG